MSKYIVKKIGVIDSMRMDAVSNNIWLSTLTYNTLKIDLIECSPYMYINKYEVDIG